MRQSHFRTYGGWPPAVGESYCWTFGLCVFEWTGSRALPGGTEQRNSAAAPKFLPPRSFKIDAAFRVLRGNLLSLWSLQYETTRAST